jgi:hypothetical protein
MRVSFIRFNDAIQTYVSPDTGLCLQQRRWLTVVTYDWANGARVRQRNFPSVCAVYAYLNKLSIGGYLDDSAYHDAWEQTLAVAERIHSLGFDPDCESYGRFE